MKKEYLKKKLIDDCDCFVFDSDGVLIRGDSVIPGAVETFNTLWKEGKLCFVMSNNSSMSREKLAHKLRTKGFKCEAETTITSSFLAADYCSSKNFSPCYVIGESGIYEELKAKGIKTIDDYEDSAKAVITGIDRHFSYQKLEKAMQLISQGAEFIATNLDSSFPTENRLIPGGGCIVKAVEYATQKKPVLVGKPNTYGLEMIVEQTGIKRNKIVLIGDSIESDLKMAKRFKCNSVLVLSGVTTTKEGLKMLKQKDSTIVLNSLSELLL